MGRRCAPSRRLPVCSARLRRSLRRLRGTFALDEARDGVGQLGAALLPKADAFERESQTLFFLGRDRVVEADALDEAAVTTVARIGDDDVVEGALFSASSGKANHYHGGLSGRWTKRH